MNSAPVLENVTLPNKNEATDDTSRSVDDNLHLPEDTETQQLLSRVVRPPHHLRHKFKRVDASDCSEHIGTEQATNSAVG